MRTCFTFLIFLFLFSACSDREKVQLPFIDSSIHSSGGASSGAGNKSGNLNDSTRQQIKPTKGKKKSRIGNAHRNKISSQPDTSVQQRINSVPFTERLKIIKAGNINPDINEPLTRQTLFGSVGNETFRSMIELSRDRYLKINFDNDILDYTDRFFTNGIRIELITPGLQMNPLSKLMVPYWRSGINYYGLSVVQNMYTPSTTKIGGILYGDRPYAAYLTLGSFKITNDPEHKFRQTSQIDLGIIGPDSYGEWVQRKFHNSVPTNNEPLGWEYQIRNDLVINYSLAYEMGVLPTEHLELMITAKGNLGTLYTNLSGGFLFRTGLMNPYFSNLGVAGKQQTIQQKLKKFQAFFYLKGSGEVVGYDATLQGGLLNKSSVYTIAAGDVSRFVLKSSAGMSIAYYGFGLEVEQLLLSPEFNQGLWHKWVHIGLRFSL